VGLAVCVLLLDIVGETVRETEGVLLPEELREMVPHFVIEVEGV